MNKILEHSYFKFVSLCLLVTGISKLYSAMSHSVILEYMDGVLLISNRSLLIMTGIIEIAIFLYVIFSKRPVRKHVVLIWLSFIFIFYRLGAWIINSPHPCPCLGSITDWLPIKPFHLDIALKSLIALMIIGSISFLAMRRRLIFDSAAVSENGRRSQPGTC